MRPRSPGLDFVLIFWTQEGSSLPAPPPDPLLVAPSVFWWLLTVVLLQVLVGALESSGDIVSVSCCDNEIFILKGDRDVIRLSDCPEGVTSDREHRHRYLLAS